MKILLKDLKFGKIKLMPEILDDLWHLDKVIRVGDKVKSSIRLAQSYALAVPQEATQRVVCGYGIHTDGTSIIKIYHLYNNNFEANPEACNNSVDLDYTPGASLTKVDDNAINLGTNYKATSSKIFLKTPYGEVYSNNTKLTGVSIGYIKIDKDGNISDIEINGGGQINF
jgi:hypothetical protein